MIEDTAGGTPWVVELPEQAQPYDERFILVHEGKREEIHLHDYARVYSVPGLYEYVVQDLLQCKSPAVAVRATSAAAKELHLDIKTLRILDLGAGVGVVGELLHDAGVSAVVGLDNIVEARTACDRDRPTVYEDYIVGDLGRSDSALVERLAAGQFEVLMCVGAIGGGHVPPAAFIQAVNTLIGAALIVMTVHERWLEADSRDPFSATLHAMINEGYLEVLKSSSFRHRLDMAGAPITYRVLVLRRGAAVPADLASRSGA